MKRVKRAKEKKTKRAKTIKQLTAMGRRHLLGVRVVMKNMVYVVGMKLPAPTPDEVSFIHLFLRRKADMQSISILRTNEYFGQYGKISKLYIRDRSPLSSSAVHTLSDDPASHGIYIVYVRREDAARAISSLDGIPAPSGAPGTTLKASYGTTRYCDSFLRGMKCDSPGCHYLHEWGGDSDCFSKDDYETAYVPLVIAGK
jgi:CCR4-NOT transcription complex subunit 4